MMVSKAKETDGFAGGTRPHIPVLFKPMLEMVAPKDGDVIVDGTFGAGGYSRGILEAADCTVIGIDQDPDAIAGARDMLREFGPKLQMVRGRFSDLEAHMASVAKSCRIDPLVDGVVLDIGVSSMQLDQERRGFSFRNNGPLDMRMSQEGPTAADLVNGLSEEEIATVLWRFGDERKSRYIARAIVARRETEPFKETGDLAALIEKVVGKKHNDKIHPATRSFQALRIYLNDELGQLLQGLNAASKILKPGGRLVVVSFHSLEDRIVKAFMRLAAGRVPNQSRHLPDVNKEICPSFQIINPKPVKADRAEIEVNPRSRSAVLRAAVRLEAPFIEYDEAVLGLKPLQL